MEKYIFEITQKVRDYECDSQGIVNNANYQHYLEHARHEFLAAQGNSFLAISAMGINPVVSAIHIQYKTPLRGNDHWICRIYLKREGAKFIFFQDIYRGSDDKLCVVAKVETVSTRNGKISKGEELAELFKDFL